MNPTARLTRRVIRALAATAVVAAAWLVVEYAAQHVGAAALLVVALVVSLAVLNRRGSRR